VSKDRRLGRGLAALLGTTSEINVGLEPTEQHAIDQVYHAHTAPTAESAAEDPPTDGLLRLHVGEIDENPFQPRRDFGDAEIASLAESLREHDMLQPVLVRRNGDRFQLISGERRLRAAIQAGWSTVPARVRDADDRLVAELAIVENLQRKDLNPIEKALSFKRYLDQHHCAQEELAGRLKIDRSTIANLLRLLELPEQVIELVRSGTLTAGHARALLPLGDEQLQVSFAQRIKDEQWSVRDAERRVQEHIQAEDREPLSVVGSPTPPSAPRSRNDHVASLEQQLRNALGTRVDIRQNAAGRGKIIVHFTSHAEFDRLRSFLDDSRSRARSEAG